MANPSNVMRLAVIGLGAIGGAVLDRLLRDPLPGVGVAAACDVAGPSPAVAGLLASAGIPFVRRAEELLAYGPDHVLEAAGVEAARTWTPFFLERGVSCIVMSVGGLADPALFDRLASLCRPAGPRLVIPSGAVGGLDIVRAAAKGDLRSVRLTTTKPAEALDGPEGPAVTVPVVLYRGDAGTAVERFPRNINVAMALALAGLGAERTEVEIVADPACTENTHRVLVEGDFGTAEITLRNRPSPANPRTSHLAVLSVLATLERLAGGVLIGS